MSQTSVEIRTVNGSWLIAGCYNDDIREAAKVELTELKAIFNSPR